MAKTGGIPNNKGNPNPKSTKGMTVRKRNMTRVIPSTDKIAGNETLYKPEHAIKVKDMCLLGLSNDRIASLFDITKSTIEDWQKAHPEFKQAMFEGREGADQAVAKALYHRAIGYSHDSEEIKVLALGNNSGSVIERVKVVKQYPPSETAAMHWLRLRQRDQWEVNANGSAPVADIAAEARAAIAASIAETDDDEEGA